jgi:hypothetical protein
VADMSLAESTDVCVLHIEETMSKAISSLRRDNRLLVLSNY